MSGFYVDGTGGSKKLFFTQTNGVTETCTFCEVGHVLDTGACVVFNILNFLTQVPNLNQCSVCQLTFYLARPTSRLAQSLSNCLSYTASVNECSVCVTTRYYVSGTICALIADCTASSEINQACITCTTGDYPSGTGFSAQSVPNCASYTPNTNICFACTTTGFYVSTEICTQFLNCSTSSGTTQACTICTAGNYPSETGCLLQNSPNCQTITPNTITFTLCATTGYPLSSGLCVKILSCGTNDGFSATCTVCATDYHFVGAECISDLVPNCQETVTVSTCTTVHSAATFLMEEEFVFTYLAP